MSDTLLSTDEWPYSPKFQDFADFLGLPADHDAKGVNWRYDDRTAKKIEELYTWGRSKANTNDHDQIKLTVKNLTRGLGVNWVGKSLVDRLWQYITMEATNPHLSKQLYSEKQPEQRQPKANANGLISKQDLGTMDKLIEKATEPIKRQVEQRARQMVEQRTKQLEEQAKKQVQQKTQEAINTAVQSVFKTAFK